MIKPKHSFVKSNNVFQPEVEFVNREEAKRLFTKSMDVEEDEYKIIMYYGVGGIGKSRLKQELKTIHNSTYPKNVLRFTLDFSTPENRSPGEAIINLVDSCESDKKLRFECFELAYSLYFRKKYPDIAYDREKEDFVSKFEMGFNIMSIFDGGITQTTVNLVDKFTRTLNNRSIDEEIKNDLKNFDNLSIKEIEERLPAYLEYDLNFIKSRYPEINVVFMMLTFEALNVNETEVIRRNKNERWVKEFIANFPGNLFVFFGREKLHWENIWDPYIELYGLNNLEINHSYEFLIKAGIKDEKIQSKIVNSCGGYPFYLSLALNTYADIINNGEKPMVKDFGKTYSEIIERFIYNLKDDEIELLKILSIPRFYTKGIWELLIKEFVPGYYMTKLDQFSHNSFINIEKEKYFIHSLMKEGLKKYIDDENYFKVHKILCEYYERKFESLNLKEVFLELINHKAEITDINEFERWMRDGKIDYLLTLQRRGEQNYILNVVSMIIEKFGLRQLPIELVNIYIDIIHLGGDYEDAVTISDSYLSKFSDEEIISDKNILKIKIRKIHHSMFCHPVDNLVESATALAKNNLISKYKKEYGELLFLIGGNLGLLTGDFDFSEHWLTKTFRYAKENNNIDLELRGARKLIDLYSVNGKSKEAFDLAKKYITLDTEFESRYHIYLIGSLGEVYRKRNKFDEAKYCFERLEKITESRNLPGWSAHSYLGQAMICLSNGKVGEAEEYVARAQKIYTQINQKWGKITADTIECMCHLYTEKDIDIVIKDLYLIKEEAQKMNYYYNVKVIDELIDSKKYRNFHLLFL